MKATVAHMLSDLSAREVADIVALTAQFHKRFASVAGEVLKVAKERGIDERAARLSIATETLLLSATMYTGTTESFLECARRALEETDHKTLPKAGAR